MGGLSRKHVVQGCEANLRRSEMETIDLYQVHRFDPDTPTDEMLSGLDQLVRQGKVRVLRRQLDGRVAVRPGAEPVGAAQPGAVRHDAEPLQAIVLT